MPARGPFKLPYTRGLPRLPKLKEALADSTKRPVIGITQGGSSRKSAGAKPAATNGLFRPTKRRVKDG